VTNEKYLICVHSKVAIPLLCLERQLLLGDNENNNNEDGDFSNLQKRCVDAIVHNCSSCKDLDGDLLQGLQPRVLREIILGIGMIGRREEGY
jgi:hypothetical protein